MELRRARKGVARIPLRGNSGSSSCSSGTGGAAAEKLRQGVQFKGNLEKGARRKTVTRVGYFSDESFVEESYILQESMAKEKVAQELQLLGEAGRLDHLVAGKETGISCQAHRVMDRVAAVVLACSPLLRAKSSVHCSQWANKTFWGTGFSEQTGLETGEALRCDTEVAAHRSPTLAFVTALLEWSNEDEGISAQEREGPGPWVPGGPKDTEKKAPQESLIMG
ncbi:hypothetical protein NDU88_001436 [Pleurodeles waltl]|uniref:Uncharacterized protein n=1 Tax=Pleurodeles waltl TaxID=8319 RepID=A0AAV7LFX1_PLEWA|nr:hypothetical protein NDU88_001436 [Pleurodeles waltl]